MNDAIATEFDCPDTLASRTHAILKYVLEGGQAVGNTDWMTIVGITRSDVAKVVALHANGSLETLPLNQWRAFSYSASSGGLLPLALAAYTAEGAVLEVAYIRR